MRRRLATYLLLGHLAMAALMSCAPAGARGGGATDPRLITREELQQTGLQTATALQAVQRLRPRWLDRHPVYGLSRVRVVIDDVHAGGVDALRGLNSNGIASIRFMSPSEARGVLALGSLPVDAAIVVKSEFAQR
ncbi:MAG TPA: hypothetical protein VJ596_02455 [Gemmatimonadaceae bacterium]|nr:hypothetical protein [Gemmatimonadaceae bacterium]